MSGGGHRVILRDVLTVSWRMLRGVELTRLKPQKVKDPEKAAELRAQLQRLDQQLAADRAAQRRSQLVSGIKVCA